MQICSATAIILEVFPIELLQLQYFKTIAECQHITNAANKLMVSQPSLSNTLSRIEGELGVRLFDRQGRNIVLNHYGEIVLRHANNILREIDNIHAEINEIQQKNHQQLNIASTTSMYVNDWLPYFFKSNPQLNIRHRILNSEKIKEELLNGTLDFGITNCLQNIPELDHYTLWQDEYIVLVPNQHHLCNLPSCKFADLADEHFVALSPSLGVPRLIDELAEKAGFTPKIIFEGEKELIQSVFIPSNSLNLAFKSIFKAPGDLELCRQYCQVLVLTDDFAKIDVSLSWDKARYLGENAKHLLNFVHNTDLLHIPQESLISLH